MRFVTALRSFREVIDVRTDRSPECLPCEMANFVSLVSFARAAEIGVSEDNMLVQYWDWILRSEEFGDYIVKRLEM